MPLAIDTATELYFYEDLYCRELEVTITEYGKDEKFGAYLVFDKTIFHAHGGGQKGDRGTIRLLEEPYDDCPQEFAITDTRRDKTGKVIHLISQPLDEQMADVTFPGCPAILNLDWDFRFTQMRLHSAAHLLHVFIERQLGQTIPNPNVSDLQDDYGLNVYDGGLDMTPDNMPKILQTMNSFLSEGHSIETYSDSTRTGFRYWKCDEVVIPCGGTHPHNTSEMGDITAEFSVKKGKAKVLFRLA